MRVSNLAAAALVLTGLVFAPISSHAGTVIFEGNTAIGIDDLDIGGVFYDITFVHQTGNSLYGERGQGDFPFEASNAEEQVLAASIAINEALNATLEVAITRVGPQNSEYFLIAADEENTDPGNPETPWVYGVYESRYAVDSERRPPDVWTLDDNFFINLCIFNPCPPGSGIIDIEPFPFGTAAVPQDDPFSWAMIEPAAGEPPPANVSVGGSVTGLEGSGLVLQNNGADDEPIAADGDFTFDTPVTVGSGYSVTVKTQPSVPRQFCKVARGFGTVPADGVDDVLVICVDPPVPHTAFLPAVYFVLGL